MLSLLFGALFCLTTFWFNNSRCKFLTCLVSNSWKHELLFIVTDSYLCFFFVGKWDECWVNGNKSSLSHAKEGDIWRLSDHVAVCSFEYDQGH